MHTLFTSRPAFSTDAAIASATVTPVLGDTAKPTEAKSNIATVAVPKRVRKLANVNKPAKPADKPVAAKPGKPATKPAEIDVHGMRGSYCGASPSFRMHGHKLSPIVLNRIPNSYTERDAAFLRDLHTSYGVKPFARRDADAGAVSRLIGHGYLRHVSGELDMRDATFAVTAKAVTQRFSPKLSGKPAK